MEAQTDTAPRRSWRPGPESQCCSTPGPADLRYPTCRELGSVKTQDRGWGCILRDQLRVLDHVDWGLGLFQDRPEGLGEAP